MIIIDRFEMRFAILETDDGMVSSRGNSSRRRQRRATF